ncbi:MAG: nucleotidyltransferase domain-containing protein [Vicinamibacterales bacterium]
MPRRTELPSDIDRRLESLGPVLASRCPGIDFAYLFGSSATGARTARSDVDLAISVARGEDPHAVQLEAARLASLHLGTDAVDLVLLNTAPISLAGRILTTRQVLIDRVPLVRHLYESRTAREFQDFRIREHRILAGLARASS